MANAKDFGDARIYEAYDAQRRSASPAGSETRMPQGSGFIAPNATFASSSGFATGSMGIPGGAAYGRPYENGPTLSPNLLGRFAPTERFNYVEVIGNTTNSQGWVSVSCERPTLLIPTEQLFGSVYFAPHAVPSSFGTNSAILNAKRAEGPGVCYLWAPGTWYVKYNAGGTPALRAKFLQISAEDPAIVAAAMSMPGCQKNSLGLSPVTLPASTSTIICNANPARRCVVVQVLTTGVSISKPIYIQMNGNASATLFVYALTSPFQSITFADEAMNTGILTAYTDLATNEQLQVVEYE